MKKIIAAVLVGLFPLASFAQMYGGMTGGYQGNYHYYQPGPGTLLVAALIPLLWLIFWIFFIVFWFVMLIDAIKHAPEKMKVVWVLVIILTSFIGALIYYFVEKRPRILSQREHKKLEEGK